MQLAQLLFKSCAAQSRWLDLLLIRCFAVALGLLGSFYIYVWIRWLIVPFAPHPRAWLDPYMFIGIPMVIFAIGLFQISRLFVLITALLAFLIAVFFTIGWFKISSGLDYRAMIVFFSFLLFSSRLSYIGLSK